MLFKPLDFIVIIFALCAVIVSFYLIYSGRNGPVTVCLKSENGVWVFPADSTQTITASGPLGETVIEISGGKARIISSPCINQTCVSSGSVRLPGQWSACLPNRVMLYIHCEKNSGKGENDVDAEVR